MTTRQAHLVGSLPGATAAEAMGNALAVLGPYLRSLPDGETGERRNWVLSIVEGLRAHPDLELLREGDWSDYGRTPRFRVRPGHRLFGATLDLGHVASARQSFPAFVGAVGAAGRHDLAFQQGVPSDLDLALFALGPGGALRHPRAFTEATLVELRQVADLTGPTTLFQIEMPAELVLLARAPARARPPLARLLARGVAQLAAGSPAGTRFALHLCVGDMNNRAFGTLDDVSPLVLLANALLAAWPGGRPLDLLHAPFAAADRPAPADPAFYAPLRGLRLPAGLRFAAGFVHEAGAVGDLRRVRDLVEEALGRTVVVSSACGLGRRTDEAAQVVLERTAELCAA